MGNKKKGMAYYALNGAMAIVLSAFIIYLAGILDVEQYLTQLERDYGRNAPSVVVGLFAVLLMVVGSRVDEIEDFSGGFIGSGIIFLLIAMIPVLGRSSMHAGAILLGLGVVAVAYLIKKVK